MANDVVIRAEGLGKKYLIGHQAERERYTALRDVIARSARNFKRSVSDLLGGRANVAGDEVEEFWALKDVAFEIKRGEVVGVIGRNGAGKSTLLKILSRITEPTVGRVEIRGRVASLLEVGTGFHPELTGRENIYLNGAILGMSRAEIKRKFDEIVAFAEVEKFLDTPVKRYSSGMYVRLAFAVAAHLEPEILVVDEVLAVGDAEFQKKCLGKMKDVADNGRTVLFVSHNMAAIRNLCSKVAVLKSGRLVDMGNTGEVIRGYFGRLGNDTSYVGLKPLGHLRAFIERVELPQPTCSFGDTLQINIDLVTSNQCVAALEIEVHDQRENAIAYVSTAPMLNFAFGLQADSRNRLCLELGPLALATGRYSLHFWLIHPWVENLHILPQPLQFEIVHSDPGKTGFDFKQAYGRGAFTIPMKWTINDH